MANFKRIPVMIDAATGKQIDEFGSVVRDNDFFRLLFDETVILCCQFYDLSWTDGEAQLSAHPIAPDLTLAAFGDNDFDYLTPFMFLSEQTEDEDNMVNIAEDWFDGATADPASGQLSFRIDTNTTRFAEALNSSGLQNFYFCITGIPSGQTAKSVLAYFRFKAENRPSSSAGEPVSGDPEYLNAQEVQALVKSAPDFQFSIDGSTDWHDTQVDADRYYREQHNGGEWSEAIALVIGPQGNDGDPGTDGADAFVYVAYASDNSGTGWNLTPSDTLKYRAEIHSETALTPVESDFSGATWVKYLGDDGADGTNGTNGTDGVDGTNGTDGADAFVYVAYASDNSGTDWNLTPSDTLKYRAEIHSETALTPVESDFSGATWLKYLGDDGTNGTDGADGTSITVKGSDTYSNIIAITGATAGDLWISTTTNADPVVAVGDGFVSDGADNWTNVGPIQGPQGETGATGAAGTDAYVYVAYASDNSGTDWNLTPSDTLKYRAEIHSITALTPVESDFSSATWVKYIGDDGSGGVGNVVLSSISGEAFIYPKTGITNPFSNASNSANIGYDVDNYADAAALLSTSSNEPMQLSKFKIPTGTTSLKFRFVYSPETGNSWSSETVVWKGELKNMTDNNAWSSVSAFTIGTNTVPSSGSAPQLYEATVSLATLGLSVGDVVQMVIYVDSTSSWANDVAFQLCEIEVVA